MLVLTRRVGEGVVIGMNIRIVVVEIRGGQVRLGIEAPAEIAVSRDEIDPKLRSGGSTE
jgi:carbon storage regulator